MKILKLFVVSIFIVVFFVAFILYFQEKEQKIKISEIPKKIVKVVNEKVPGGKITEAEKEMDKGKVVYDIDVVKGNKRYEVEVYEDGTIKEFKALGEEEEEEMEGEIEYNFDKEKPHTIPSGWKNEFTGRGKLGKWEILEDETAPSKPNVLAQTSMENFGYHFNLAILENSSYKDLELSVKFKGVKGNEDRGGGPVWRYIDRNNYYIARANPLENNFRVYKVVNGNRRQMDSKSLKVTSNEWHTIKIRMVGDKIECYYDGVKYLEVKDSTFKKAGKIGLWTKADAYTYFDDLEVEEIK
ncbi:hypothetical protein DRQ09_01965 [candidate division KSB1 bacterium]|nr:MAG: hypothetical protein DRQ09_01965 [candidate division KSB1 bacterium]